MKVVKLLPLFVIIVGLSNLLLAQTSPDVENGFKDFGSYDHSSLDSVDLKSGNLIIHIPMPWTYPQRGSAIAPHNLLTVSSKSWTTSCNSGTITMDGVEPGSGCYWAPGIWRDQQVSLAGHGLGFDHTLDLSVHRTWGYQTDPFSNVTYFSNGYGVATPDGGTHGMVASAGAALDPNGNPMAYDARDTSGFHLDLSNPNTTDGTPDTAILTDRHGNRFKGDWVTQPNCRAVFDNQLNGNSSSKNCGQATRLTGITDANGNVFSTSSDTMGRSFQSYTYSAASDSTLCVLNGLTFISSSVINYAGPNGATNQAKLCYATVTVSTAFGVSGVTEAQNKPGLTGPLKATVLATIILPDSNNAISASSPKWVFNYDNYINLIYMGLPMGGSISYTWQTLNLGFPCTKISRVVASRTVNDNNVDALVWNYSWGAPSSGSSPSMINKVTDPLGNDTLHVFTDVTAHGTCPSYETQTQYFQGSSASQLLKQIDTGYSFNITLGYVIPTSVQTTLFPSHKISLVTKIYDSGPGTNLPIFANVTKEMEYDWGQGSPGALLRETDTTYQWQKDSRYLTAHLLDLPASIVVISPAPNGNPKTNCPGWDSSGNATTKACMAETDYTYDEAVYLTGYEATVGTLPAGTHVSAPNPVRGLQTTVSRWLNTTNAFIISHTNWYDTGEPHQAIDPLGHTTTHSYDPAYAGAYSTQTCNAKAQCVSGVYDFQTGALASFTDANNTTRNYWYDTLGRLIDVLSPADASGSRPHSHFTPSEGNVFPPSITRQQWITSSLIDTSTHLFDGLGRSYQIRHTMPSGPPATIDTVFDALDHVASVSNPYFSTSDATYGVTQTLYDALGRAYQTTKQDGSVSSVDFSGGTCILATDEAGHQRKSCSDALGRLVEVDEPNPIAGPSSATGTVTINGNEQSTGGVATSGSVTVTVSGNEQSAQYCPLGHCRTLWNIGDVTITVNGFTKTASYSQFVNTPALIASALAYAFHTDPSSPVDGVVSGNSVVLTAWAAGGSTNYAFTTSSSTSDQTGTFFSPSFRVGPASGALAGGHDGGIFDSGTLSVTVNGVSYSVTFGTGDTASSIASRLAPAISAGSWANASATGNQVNLTSKTPGPGGNYSLSAAYTWNSVQFLNPSFASSASGGSLTGGFNPGDIADSPYITLYQYDALGNLLRVDQKGSAPTDSTQWRTRTFIYDSLSRLLTATNPESGTITYLYDADGNLLQKTSPAPNQTGTATQTVSYCYDELHRVTAKGYGAQSCPLATPVVTYTYDSGTNAKGHLTSLTDQAGTASYSYDILGRLATETRTLTGANSAAISKSLSYDYNLDGSLKTLHYPSGAAVTYAPDSAGRVLSAIDSGSGINYITGATYGPDSALTGFVSGNSATFAGITSAFGYNKRLQPVAMSANAPSQTVFSIGYDFHVGNGTTGADNGNVFGITNYKDNTRNQTFIYDALNRLASAQNAGTDCTVNVLGGNKKFWGNNYGYDAWGNLLSKSVAKCSSEALSVVAGNNNRLAGAYLYDAAGNMTHDATSGLNYTFDQENRITGAAGFAYTYDGDGNRVRKSNGNLAANGTLYWEMTPGVVAETDLAGALKSEYVFFDGERVARRDGATGTGGVFYYFSDHLKTASVITDSAGVIKAESDYYPWGGELQFVNNDSNDYKFTGKERDNESGLDYFGARYMASSMGRFMSPDWSAKAEPVPYAKLDNPQTLNLYAYVGNNPLSRFDPDGHCADHYKDGSCKVNVDPKTGDAGAKAGKQLEGVLNKYDKAINALGDKSKFDIKDSKGNVVGSLTGSEIKAVWNGTSFTVTSQTNFGNGGAGGGTSGTWNGDSFSGHSNLSPGAISAYANAASDRNEAPMVGLNTLTFHELGHETHYGESLTMKYPVTPTISWPREYGASSAGSRMANTVGAPFDCSIPGGCQ